MTNPAQVEGGERRCRAHACDRVGAMRSLAASMCACLECHLLSELAQHVGRHARQHVKQIVDLAVTLKHVGEIDVRHVPARSSR